MNKDQIKSVALEMAQERGLINLTRSSLCARAGIQDGSFQAITGVTFGEFFQELMRDMEGHRFTGPVERNRANPELRKDQLLSVAVQVAAKVGYNNITRHDIATAGGVSISLVTTYLGTMKQLKRSLMRAAIKEENLAVIAQGLACGDPCAKKAPQELKKAAAEYIANN